MPYQRVNELVNGRRGITPSTALRLAKFFGTSAEIWMNLQQRWDLYRAEAAEATARYKSMQTGGRCRFQRKRLNCARRGRVITAKMRGRLEEVARS